VDVQVQSEKCLNRVDASLDDVTPGHAPADPSSRIMIQRQIDEHLDNIDELLLNWEFAREGPAYLSPIARRLRDVESGPLADLLDEAIDEGRMTDDDRNAIMRADIVLSGRRRQDGQEVYLVVEISGGIGLHDVERVVDRAVLLRKLGRPVVPVVAGRRIHDDAAELARALGAWCILEGQVTPPIGA
jgi:hypothetical protein